MGGGDDWFVMEIQLDYSESQSSSDSMVVLSVVEGEGGSGGSNSCIRYLSLIKGLTSSCRKGRKRRDREIQNMHNCLLIFNVRSIKNIYLIQK